MKPEHIELFIDRLCGLHPKDNIARNTVKNAWVKDEFLLDAKEEDAAKALKIIENDQGFPNLARVKSVLRKISLVVDTEQVNDCKICDGTGWDTGLRYEEDKSTDPIRVFQTHGHYTNEWLGKVYPVVKQCACVGG